MVAFDFPSSPTGGQSYSPVGGPTYVWNGVAWEMVGTGAAVSATYVGVAPPPAPTAGQLWWDSDAGRLFIYYDDGNSSQWVEAISAATDLSGYAKLNSSPIFTGKVTAGFEAGTAVGFETAGHFKSGFGFFTSGNAAAVGPGTAGTVYLRPNGILDAAGEVQVTSAGDVYVARHHIVAGVVAPNGGGVQFPAAQVASANANTLDDYEEGVWTPSLQFAGANVGMTYSANRSGVYVKVGGLCTAWFDIGLTALGTSTGSASIAGIPFTGVGATLMAGSMGYTTGMGAGYAVMSCYAGAAVAFTLTAPNSASGVGTALNTASNANFTSTSRIIGQCSYRVA